MMVRTAGLFFALLALTTSSYGAGASLEPKAASICVQRQLDAAGYDVGTIDGVIGRRSIAAATDYAAANGLTEPDILTRDNAEAWCRALAGHSAALAPFLEAAEADTKAADARFGAAGDFQYDIGPDVPADQIELIKTGIARAETYLSAQLGGGIPQEVRETITVKIVATGKGNMEPGGGGGVATAFAGSKMRPFFDVANAQWNQNSRGRGWTTPSDSMKTVAHEYAHIWQGHMGAINGWEQPLPGWLNEGLAEYLGYRVMVDAGEMKWEDVRPFVLNGALQDQLAAPLQNVNTWPGHVGFVAVDWLVDEGPNGLSALRIVAEEVGKGATSREAFKMAFGLELLDFYAQFEAWRPEITKNPAKAFERRPALVLP